MGWSMVKMSDADISKKQAFRLQAQFEAVFTTALSPKDAAMFGNLHPVRDNHLFYFSPKATEIFSTLLSAFSPIDCSAPKKESVALLVGHDGARDAMLS